MAWLQQRGTRFHINLEFRGQHVSRSLRTSDPKHAAACLKRVEANVAEVERGRLRLPPGGDLLLFLLSDGDTVERPAYERPLALGELFKQYQAAGEGGKESTTRYTEGIHIKHLLRILGRQTSVASISHDVLQGYVDARSGEQGRYSQLVSDATIRKEIGTLASIWNLWARPKGLVDSPAPSSGILYRKAKAKPPFQTMTQIEERLARAGKTTIPTAELWESLFLTLTEIDELLAFVQASYKFQCIRLMFVFAAHTGARRSEMIRSEVGDFDFTSGMVTIREKKRDQSKDLTFRHVPMSPLLRQTMASWLAVHPGGTLTICQRKNVPLTPQLAHHHFRWALDESKWKVLRGWHVLRHSFCSNCAMKGLDQRIIDSWMGHQTEAMRSRYRHLFPDQQQRAIESVFGPGQRQ